MQNDNARVSPRPFQRLCHFNFRTNFKKDAVENSAPPRLKDYFYGLLSLTLAFREEQFPPSSSYDNKLRE